MKCYAVLAVFILAGAFASGLAGPADGKTPAVASKRAFDTSLHPLTVNQNLTKGAFDTAVTTIGVGAFVLAFIVIPLLAVLFTSSSTVNPVLARSIKEYLVKPATQSHSRHARGILDNDRCIERIVCELQKGARNTQTDKWADAFFTQVPSEGKFMRRVSSAYRSNLENCNTYACEPVGFVIRLFIYATDWNTILKG